MENLEKILNNPGFQHLAENIFWNLDYEDLKICREINQSSKRILDNPHRFPEIWFVLKKLVQRGLSKKNQEDWEKIIQSEKNTDTKEKFMLWYFKLNLKDVGVIDLPCYTNPNNVQEDSQDFQIDILLGDLQRRLKLEE